MMIVQNKTSTKTSVTTGLPFAPQPVQHAKLRAASVPVSSLRASAAHQAATGSGSCAQEDHAEKSCRRVTESSQPNWNLGDQHVPSTCTGVVDISESSSPDARKRKCRLARWGPHAIRPRPRGRTGDLMDLFKGNALFDASR